MDTIHGVAGPSKSSKGANEKTIFVCKKCNFLANYKYKGKLPLFMNNLLFDEEFYVSSNLFSSSESENLIIIGCDCAVCAKPVCSSNLCSIFYKQNFCTDCAYIQVNRFPNEIRNKIERIYS